VTEVARATTTGMTEEQSQKANLAPQPMVVYLYADSGKEDEDPRAAIESDRAFTGNEKVAVGARFFTCLRIEAADARRDKILKKYIRKAPCLVFVRPCFEPVAVLRAKFNANRIFDAMCATMRKDYQNCVPTVLKEQRKIGKQRDALQRDKDKLARLDETLADMKRAVRSKRLSKQRDVLEARITRAEAELARRENALYVLQPKPQRTQEA